MESPAHGRALAGALLALLPLGCGGGSHGTGFGSDPGATGSSASDGGDDGGGSVVPPPSDSGLLQLSSSDGAPSGLRFDCQPGTYSGMYKVHVGTDAGLLPQLVSFDVSGTLSITLVGTVTMSGSGEALDPVLSIAPGAKLAGVDATFGGSFSADVSGQLDCPSKTFTGTLANGTYEYPGDAGSLMMTGNLSATYDGTATPPALTMGVMELDSAQLNLGSTGPWSATLQ